MQRDQQEIARHAQRSTGLVPSSAVANHGGHGAGGHLGADLCQMEVHALGVHGRRDHGGTDRAGRADRTEEISCVMAVIPHHDRARAFLGPDIAQRPLLPDAGFILEPYLDRHAGPGSQQQILQAGREVFLKASCAAGSRFG